MHTLPARMLAALPALALASPALGEEPGGWDVQGLPLISYTTDEGFGYGARVLLVDRGGEQRPYRYSIGAQFYQTTKGVAAHLLFLDAPGLFGSLYRVELELAWAIYKFFPYYGIGKTSTYHSQFDTCDDRVRWPRTRSIARATPPSAGSATIDMRSRRCRGSRSTCVATWAAPGSCSRATASATRASARSTAATISASSKGRR